MPRRGAELHQLTAEMQKQAKEGLLFADGQAAGEEGVVFSPPDMANVYSREGRKALLI